MFKNKNIAILFFILIVAMFGFVTSLFYLSSQTNTAENPVSAD